MKDNGYWQAIQNVAYEIFNAAETSEANGESAEDMFALAMIDPKRKQYWDTLDQIMNTISTTYKIDMPEVQSDALTTIMEYHLKKQGLMG